MAVGVVGDQFADAVAAGVRGLDSSGSGDVPGVWRQLTDRTQDDFVVLGRVRVRDGDAGVHAAVWREDAPVRHGQWHVVYSYPQVVAAADHFLPPWRVVWFFILPEATGRGFEAFCRGGVRSEQIGAIFGAFRGGPSPYLW